MDNFGVCVLDLHAVYLILYKSEYCQTRLCQRLKNPSTITAYSYDHLDCSY